MGVTGLWRLIEPSGKPVPLETLENKILAVDVSIWLHQAIKGFQDAQGGPLPNAHLLGIYHRVCKLLYFRVKPVFIFDGGVPNLKKETIYKRQQQKSKKLNEAERIQKHLLTTLLKHSAVSKVLSEATKTKLVTKSSPTKTSLEKDDIYKLPETNFDSTLSTEEDESTSESTTQSSPTKHWDLHSIDEKSPYFKSLPADVRHEILTDLKETRKQSSWGRLHELPKQSDDFSCFQMTRLLKRNSVQVSLEEAEKEMGGHSLSLAELEMLLKDQGVDMANNSVGSRIASDENTRYLLIKDVKKAMDDASKQKQLSALNDIVEEDDPAEKQELTEQIQQVTDAEFNSDLEKAIQLSLQDQPSTSKDTKLAAPNFSFLDDADFQSTSESEGEEHVDEKQTNAKLSSAKSYMMEYSGLTPAEISKIIGNNSKVPNKNKINFEKIKEKKNDNVIEKNGESVVSKSTSELINIKDTFVPKENISGTTGNIGALNVNNEDVSDSRKTIEVVPDSDDDSDDLLEVPNTDHLTILTSTNNHTNAMEILIKPEDSLEDDMFDDIFSNENCSKITDKSDLEVESKLEQTQSITVKMNVSEAKEITNNDDLARKEEHKEEKTKNIVAEFVKPLVTKSDKFSVDGVDKNSGTLTKQQLQTIEEELRLEKEELIIGMSSKERMASNLTEQMYEEAQELLQLFGVPFLVAPMEAEAQCAYLDDINLTDGTITDDSDVWLFGGKTVYKNFFNQHKHVMEFRAENIQHHFKLTREQMILLALLVGSDYTVGLQGIGPVTALEILAAFPSSKQAAVDHGQLISGLQAFQNWLNDGRVVGPGRTSLRNKLKNVTLTDSFPSLQVVKAYLDPTIDSSKEPFSWAKPDIAGLLEFAKKKFGWTRIKSEEILKPVLKRLNETRIQKSIKDYFRTKHKIVDCTEAESKMSKRVKTAVNRIGKDPDEIGECSENNVNKRKGNRKSRKTKTVDVAELNPVSSEDDDIKVLKQTKKVSKKKLQQIEDDVKAEIEQQTAVVKKPRTTAEIHKKEVIPQKERDKVDALRSKIKAIEVFRKSKRGPGFVSKRKVVKRKTKDDAELSESSSD